MNDKEKYRELCRNEMTIPIFSKDWWLDAVCGINNWDVILIEKGGQIVAAHPYYIKKKWGLRYISQPKLTQTNGVWIKYPKNQKYHKKLSFEKDLMLQIIDSLNNLQIDFYLQNFHYSISNWLPFYWNDFKQTTKYTYVIETLKDMESVYSNLDTKLRNQIRKAEKLVMIKEDCNIEQFYEINAKTFTKQGREMPYSLEFLKKIDKVCLEKNCRKIFYAVDNLGNMHAAIYIVWDENSVYYLMGGQDPKFSSSSATSLLLWNAIIYSSSFVNNFNFEGSMNERIESFFLSFGGEQKQYFTLTKNFGRNILVKKMLNLLIS